MMSRFTHFRLACLLICIIDCINDVSSWPKDPDDAMRNAIQRFLGSNSFMDHVETVRFTTSASNVPSASGSTVRPTSSADKTSDQEFTIESSDSQPEQRLRPTSRFDYNVLPTTSTSTSGPAMRLEPPVSANSLILTTESMPITLQISSSSSTAAPHQSTSSFSLPISAVTTTTTTTMSSTAGLDDTTPYNVATTGTTRRDNVSTRSYFGSRTTASENVGRSSSKTTDDDDIIVRTVDLFRIFALHSLPSDDLKKQISKAEVDARFGPPSSASAQKPSPIQTTRRTPTMPKVDEKSSMPQGASGFATQFGRHFWSSGDPTGGDRHRTEAPESASGHVGNRQLILVISVVGSLAVSGALVALVSSLMTNRCRPAPPPYMKSSLNRKKSLAESRPEAEAAAIAVVVVVDKDAKNQSKQSKQSVTSAVCCFKPPSSAKRQHRRCCLFSSCCIDVTTSTQSSAVAAVVNAGNDASALANQKSDQNGERKGGDGIECGLEKGETLDNNMNFSKSKDASKIGSDGSLVGDQYPQSRQTSTVRQMIESFDRKCQSTPGSTADVGTSTSKSKHGGRLYVPKRSPLQTAGSNKGENQQTNSHQELGSMTLLKTQTKVVTFADPVDSDDVEEQTPSGDNSKISSTTYTIHRLTSADYCKSSTPLKIDVATMTSPRECEI